MGEILRQLRVKAEMFPCDGVDEAQCLCVETLAVELGDAVVGYHAVLFIAHAAAYIYDCKYIVTNETETVFTYRGYGGKFKYLTNWNFVSPNIYL